MTTRTTWAALVVIGATAVLDLGCGGHARANGGEPNTPSSTASGEKAAPSSDDPATGSTSQAMTSSSPSSAATPPADPPAKTEPLKSDPPGHADVPGVGNRRKAEGTQPGQVGKGPTKKAAEKKVAADPHGKKKKAKAAPKSTPTTKVAANAKKKK